MASLRTLENLIAEYRLDAEGWDSVNARLTDFSGHGNHLPIAIAATPTYATRDGFQHIDFTNTYYFQGEFALPARFSSVFIGTQNANAEGICHVWAAAKNKNTADNYDDTLALNDAEYLTNTYLRKAFYFVSNLPRLYDGAGISGTGTTFAAGSINISTAVCADAKLKCNTGTGAFGIGEFTGSTPASHATTHGQFFRLGQLKGTLGALGSGNYVSGKRLYLYAGDVTEQADYAAARDAAIAEWGI